MREVVHDALQRVDVRSRFCSILREVGDALHLFFCCFLDLVGHLEVFEWSPKLQKVIAQVFSYFDICAWFARCDASFCLCGYVITVSLEFWN